MFPVLNMNGEEDALPRQTFRWNGPQIVPPLVYITLFMFNGDWACCVRHVSTVQVQLPSITN